MTFLDEPGQAARFRRAETLQSAATAVLFAGILSGSGTVLAISLPLIVAGLIHSMRAVRCPRCGYNLSWHSMSKVNIGRSKAWLAALERCPRCRYRPDGGARAPADAVSIPEAPLRRPLPRGEVTPGDDGPPPLPVADTPRMPWQLAEPVLTAPEGSAYGYAKGPLPVPCSREELIEQFRRPAGSLVAWAPSAPRPTWFWNVPELLPPHRAHRVAESRYGFWGPLAFVLAMAAGMLLDGDAGPLGSPAWFFLAIGAIVLGLRLHAAHQARRLDAATLRAELEGTLHDAWLRTQRTRLTQALAWCLALVYAAQALTSGDTARLAGMLPAAVLAGEWWRLLSYGVMHGNVVHLGFNVLALLSLGRLMEVHTHRTLLPLVFLVTVVTGGLVGLALGPAVPMVGASGGLLGLIGFLTVVGFRRRDRMPPGFARTMLMDVGFVAATGLVGFRFIANAGHLGGLLGGLALGALLVPRPDPELRVGWRPATAVMALGWACAGILALTCVATTAYLVLQPR